MRLSETSDSEGSPLLNHPRWLVAFLSVGRSDESLARV